MSERTKELRRRRTRKAKARKVKKAAAIAGKAKSPPKK